jgi:SPP1 gp7 family putative phage head morphogenesis protein
MIELRPLPFDDAIQFFRDKVVLSPKEFYKLTGEARMRAFTVSKVMEAEIIKDVHEQVLSALRLGTPFSEFRDKVMPALERAGWTGDMAYRVDNVFRTNIQSAYQAGHYKRMMQVVNARPYWQYVAVMDSRTRPTHASRNGTVLPANDPWWDTNFPPNGFRCRCTVRSLSKSEVARDDLPIEDGENLKNVADPGFEYNPGLAAWKPDTKKFPDWLKKPLDKALATPPKEEKPYVGLAKRIKVDKPEQIGDILRLFHEENPGWFQRGFNRVDIKRSDRAFMSTDCEGRITLFNHRFPTCANHNPARDLASALKKINAGKDLTFNEEYAVESIWHEVLHNRAKGRDWVDRSSASYELMETVNQFCARHTYGLFLEKLGGTAKHSEAIIEGGYGYGHRVRNLHALLMRLEIEDAEILPAMEKINTEGSWAKHWDLVADALASHRKGPGTRDWIKSVLERINLWSEESFRELMK